MPKGSLEVLTGVQTFFSLKPVDSGIRAMHWVHLCSKLDKDFIHQDCTLK